MFEVSGRAGHAVDRLIIDNPVSGGAPGIPSAAVAGEWVDDMPGLKRLRATCLSGWHETLVGSEFRWSDEEIRLSPSMFVTLDRWERARGDFGQSWRLWCVACGRFSRMSAKGWAWAS